MQYTLPQYTRILKERLGWKYTTPGDDQTHLDAAIRWLCLAQDVTTNDGVAQTYLIRRHHWANSYPETTGYIIPTFFSYAALTGNDDIRQRAIRMADWEIAIQHKTGGVLAGALGDSDQPTVFNTGQVLFGWVRAFEETGQEKYRAAAIRATDWLCDIQDPNGAWTAFGSPMTLHKEKKAKPNTYNTRSAWGILRVYQITENDRYRQAAIKNAEWALTQKHENGWLENNCLQDDSQPFVHTIAYAMRGLLEIGNFCQRSDFLEAAIQTGKVLAEKIPGNGFLPGKFDSNWHPAVNWSCMTGNSQMAINWQRLAQITGERSFIDAARKANQFNKSHQKLHGIEAERGGITGSHPINGGYHPWQYPNWASKFFADALLLSLSINEPSNNFYKNDG